jgi:hypothetical protein
MSDMNFCLFMVMFAHILLDDEFVKILASV